MTTVKFIINRSSNQRHVSIRRNKKTNLYIPVSPASLARVEKIMRNHEIKQSQEKGMITYSASW